MVHIQPIVIAIWCGETKPTVLNDFLRPFVIELNGLLQNGMNINGNRLDISIRAFICDTPARAFLKGIVNFNHRHGCQKCTLQGTHLNSRMSFYRLPDDYSNRETYLRTDENFRNRLTPEHHRELSILEELPIDMIIVFVIADQLHLLHLGVMKRFGKHIFSSKIVLST